MIVEVGRSRRLAISPNAEAASNNAMPLILLPLLSSAFIPVDTMPGWFQPIAEYQPFSPPSRPSGACCSAPRSATTAGS
ncbi:hypothetical protein [Spirillospora sp. NPDC047279]|uniref:hypothetical protein n=1 Tax=Spirillospora sp. NPDC047279 TaxID=3155478 RepID=UPI0033D86A73